MFQEKECEICGVWFAQTRSNQKYCEECREHSDHKKKKMNSYIKISISKHGYGHKPQEIENTCKKCGKVFITYNVIKKYCSAECREQYHIEQTTCENCGKSMIDTDDKRDVNGKMWFCSDKCREDYKWKIARKNGEVHICPNCEKEFIKKSTYCSAECYREFLKKEKERNEQLKKVGQKICASCKKKFSGNTGLCPTCIKQKVQSEPRANRKCVMCGKVFLCPASKMFVPLCSDSCNKEYNEVLHKLKKEEKSIKRKKDQINRDFIQKNGLCGICKTSYKACERMQSNYTASPEGSVFKGSKVIKCPKFSS